MKALLFVFFLAIIKSYCQEGGKVDENFLKAVVYIKKDSSSGTGFIIGVANGKDIKFFLVTNKHMIGHWSMVDSFIPAKEIIVTLYRSDENQRFFDVTIPILDVANKLNKNVVIHHDPSVDIACIYLNDFLKGVGMVSFTTLDPKFLAPLDSIKKTAFIGLGSQVFAIGYPANIMISKSNEPIVKSGHIASSFSGDLDLVERWTDRYNRNVELTNRSKYFLVDGIIIGGNSGGPVISPIINLSYERGHAYLHDPPLQNRIIGIVSYLKFNTGITIVYAADYILELIRQF
jgi:hypothetical protein